MKEASSLALLLLSFAATLAAQSVPALNCIQSGAFSAPYGCKGNYNTSALFLSDASRQVNAPELLYSAACDSPPYLMAATAGLGSSLSGWLTRRLQATTLALLSTWECGL